MRKQQTRDRQLDKHEQKETSIELRDRFWKKDKKRRSNLWIYLARYFSRSSSSSSLDFWFFRFERNPRAWKTPRMEWKSRKRAAKKQEAGWREEKNIQNWNDHAWGNWNYESRFIAWNINKSQAWNFSRDKRTKEGGQMRGRERERKWELLKYLSTHRGWWYPRSNTLEYAVSNFIEIEKSFGTSFDIGK